MGQSDVETVVRICHDVWMQVSARAAEVTAALGLNPAAAQALWMLDPGAPAPTKKQMAARMFCGPSNATFVVGQLLAAGLVEQSVHPEDRRVRVLELTASGLEARESLVAATVSSPPLAGLDAAQLRSLAAALAPLG